MALRIRPNLPSGDWQNLPNLENMLVSAPPTVLIIDYEYGRCIGRPTVLLQSSSSSSSAASAASAASASSSSSSSSSSSPGLLLLLKLVL